MTIFKRELFFSVATVLVLATIQVASAGQTRIHFPKGKTSTTVSGSLDKDGSKCFVLGTRKGQLLEGRLSSRNGKVQFPWESGTSSYKGGTKYSKVTDGGDEQLCIENNGNATTFSLTVSIR
jgi:hypothetical protein